jgi:hypothetical protein
VTLTVMTGSFNTTVAVGKRWIAAACPARCSQTSPHGCGVVAAVVPSARPKRWCMMMMSLAVEGGGRHQGECACTRPFRDGTCGRCQSD